MRFWQDGWYGDQPFQLAFLRLYRIDIDREASVKLLCQGRGRRIEEVEMFVLSENLMIGRWRKGCIFFVSWEPIFLQLTLETR